MKTITAALCAIALAALPSIATAGSAEVDIHRHVIVLPDDDVLIPRHTANVIIIDGEHRDCDLRTVRTWVAGRYVMRRVVHCDD